MILIGNKCDLKHLRAVREEEAQAFAAKHGLAFLETSAFDSTNVAQAFTDVLGRICKVVQSKHARKEGGA